MISFSRQIRQVLMDHDADPAEIDKSLNAVEP
jgi:hypothetical protein